MLFFKRTIDIYSSAGGIAGSLSNFTKRQFVFDGIVCRSIEGVLQSLKFESVAEQRIVCGLWGKQAKLAGDLKQDWKDSQTLFWNSVAYPRESDEYRALLTRLYTTVYVQDPDFRRDIQKSKKYKLVHSIGNPNPKDTVLTEAEFIAHLTELQNLRLPADPYPSDAE